ncbi:MAG: hypothetical protein PHZ26_02110 [Candidatus Gracilibacteria bacterium]|nr:hypothetical protein [Candidatus Gracilibacteria bacterium]MDD2908529.1 hypothetical protein [Candidatus Gracilibacteria bacterium]
MNKIIQKDGVKSTLELRNTSLANKLCDSVKRNIIFTITGGSGVGKDAVLNNILANNENYIKPISFTTRLPRSGEINGVDYYFISLEELQKLRENGEIFEDTIVDGNIYGYTNAELERVFATGKTPVCIVNEYGVQEICKKENENLDVFKIFVLTPTARELANRLKGRELKNAITEHVKENEGLLSRESLIGIKKKVRTICKKRFSESKVWIKTAINGDIYDGFLVNDELIGAAEILEQTFEKAINGKITK